MNMIKSISLDNTTYCIETASKRMYETCISRYFNPLLPEQDKEILEYQIEVLKFFLEHADFRKLRHKHPELTSGTVKKNIRLIVADHPKDWIIICDDKKFEPEWKELP